MSIAERTETTPRAADPRPQAMPTAAEVLNPDQVYHLRDLRRAIRFHDEDCLFVGSDSKTPISLVRWWKHLAGCRGGDVEGLGRQTGKRIAESFAALGIEATPTDAGLKEYRRRIARNTPPPKPPAAPIVEAVRKLRRDRATAAAKQAAKESAQAKAAGDKRQAEAAKQQALVTRQLWAEYTTILAGSTASREDVERLDKLMSDLRRSEDDLQRDMTVVESERECRAQLESFHQKGWEWATSGPKAELAGLAKTRPEMFDDADPPALLTASAK